MLASMCRSITELLNSLAGFKLALIQLAVTANKTENIVRACQKIAEASKAGAKVVALPVRYDKKY